MFSKIYTQIDKTTIKIYTSQFKTEQVQIVFQETSCARKYSGLDTKAVISNTIFLVVELQQLMKNIASNGVDNTLVARYNTMNNG